MRSSRSLHFNLYLSSATFPTLSNNLNGNRSCAGSKKTTATAMATAVADPAEAVVERPPPPPPLAVEYDPITGIPAEFNEYLPSNCDEYKR